MKKIYENSGIEKDHVDECLVIGGVKVECVEEINGTDDE